MLPFSRGPSLELWLWGSTAVEGTAAGHLLLSHTPFAASARSLCSFPPQMIQQGPETNQLSLVSRIPDASCIYPQIRNSSPKPRSKQTDKQRKPDGLVNSGLHQSTGSRQTRADAPRHAAPYPLLPSKTEGKCDLPTNGFSWWQGAQPA